MSIGIGFPEIINFIGYIFQKQQKANYKRKLKEALFTDFEPEVQDLSEAYDDLLINIYTLAGAYCIGSKMNPTNPYHESEEIIDRINNSYSDMEARLLQVIKTMRSHKDQFKLLFESDPDLLVQFEDFINIVDDKKQIDLCYLANKKSLVADLYRKDFDTRFIEELNQKTKQISFLDQLYEVKWIRTLNNDGTKEIFSDKEFLAELTELVQKYYSKKKMNTKKNIN